MLKTPIPDISLRISHLRLQPHSPGANEFNNWLAFLFKISVWSSICFIGNAPYINSLRQRPNRRHFADDIFKCIFENENEWISPRIPLKFVPRVRINNIPALVQIMAWRRPGDKPLSEPMMVSLLTHICVTRPQWVNHGIMKNRA